MQVLSDLAPGIKVIAVLLNPDTPFSTLALQELRPGAEARGQRLELCEVRTADRLSTSVEAAARAGRESEEGFACLGYHQRRRKRRRRKKRRCTKKRR